MASLDCARCNRAASPRIKIRIPHAPEIRRPHVRHHMALIEVADINVFNDPQNLVTPTEAAGGAVNQTFRIINGIRRDAEPKMLSGLEPIASKHKIVPSRLLYHATAI